MSILMPNWPQLGPKLAPCWRPKSIKNRSWRPGPFPWNLQDRSKSDFLDFGSIFDRFWIDFCSILDEFCIAFWLFSLSCDSFFCKLRRGAGGRGEALRYNEKREATEFASYRTWQMFVQHPAKWRDLGPALSSQHRHP